MDLDKLISVILSGLKIAIPSILVGIIGTYVVIDYVVLEGKNTELSTLKASVDVEKGQQNVLNERIKLLGDKAVFLETQLKYKPVTQKVLEAERESTIERLTKENVNLLEIKSNLEKFEGKKVEIAELSTKLDHYIKENAQLQSEVAKFSSKVLVNEYQMSPGDSWTGLGGRVTFGVSSISHDYKKGNIALAASSIFGQSNKEVQAGNKFDFSVEGGNYTLIINKVAYVGDYVTISVHKKI